MVINMHRKILVFGITILFIMSALTPKTFGSNVITSIIRNDGNTLYVGGSGPGNYTKIQDALDNASDWDTVFVYDDSSPYYENVIVDKSIKLTGEDRNNTIIDGNGEGVVVRISANHVNIRYFTIMNGSVGVYQYDKDNSVIEENIIKSCNYGIELVDKNYNVIKKNKVSRCGKGIYLSSINDSTLNANVVNRCGFGIYISNSSQNSIRDNIIEENRGNIKLINRCFLNSIYKNLIGKATEWKGIDISYQCSNNFIDQNNFYDNTGGNAYDEGNNKWDCGYIPGGNYWSDYSGNDYYRGYGQSIPGSDGIGDTPYNISGPGNNTDRYPLMSPIDSPFQTLYLGFMEVQFRKKGLMGGGGTKGGVRKAIYLNVNSSLEELPLTIVFHYTVEMNYSLKFPFWFAPLFAIGLRFRNYSDYNWESMKLLNHGYGIWYGNVTQKIILNLSGFEKGDELGLYADISVITAPSFFNSPGHNESWMLLLRIVYNIPALKDVLLHNWLLPILAPYNLLFDGPFDYPSIFLRFI